MKAYTPQTFDHLKGLDGISDAQLAEHFKLYEGYVKQVNSLNEQLDEMCERASRRAPTRTSPSSRGISASSTTA
jgi:Fe-Mn family superoxide dismutase